MNLPVALACGAVMGCLLAVLGGGGSLFIMPILLIGFHQSVTTATGTSLVVVLAGAFIGAIAHWRAGRVNARVLLSFGPALMSGAVLGATLNGRAPEESVLVVLALALVVAAVRMLFGQLPIRDKTESIALSRVIPIGMALGTLTGFAGVGGGFLIVPALIWSALVPLPEAIGTSTTLIAMSSLVGASTHIAQKHVDISLALALGTGAIVGAVIGAPLSGKIPERPLRIAFSVMVLGAAVYIVLAPHH